MTPIGRYLEGAFEYAALNYLLIRAIWPGEDAPAAGIPHAVLFGLIMQILVLRREGLKNEAQNPDPPSSIVFVGLAGVSACAAYWAGVTFDPTRAQLISGIGAAVYAVAVGVLVVQRRRNHVVSPGT